MPKLIGPDMESNEKPCSLKNSVISIGFAGGVLYV